MRSIPLTISDIQRQAWETAEDKGFHDGRSFAEACALFHSEISEALEAWRNERGNEVIAEELADTIIRIADTAHGMGMNLENALRRKMRTNANRPFRHGGKRL